MILSCCFRNPNSNKKSRKPEEASKKSLLQQYDSEPQRPRPSQSRSSSVENGTIKTIHGATLKCQQEKHPPSRIEKRLLKQRSQDSIQGKDVVLATAQISQETAVEVSSPNVSTVSQKQSRNIPIQIEKKVLIDRSRTNLDFQQKLPSPPATPKLQIGTKRFSTGGVLPSKKPDVPRPRSIANCPVLRSRENIVFSQAENSLECGVRDTSQHQDEHQIQETCQPNQINVDREALELKEREIRDLRDKFESIIKQLKTDQDSTLKQAQANYNKQLNQEISKHKKEMEEALLEANNVARETINKLNLDVKEEKEKMKEKQTLELYKITSELNDKDKQMKEAFEEIEQREQAWQDEREDIISEVQRLKAEASKMIQILAEEYEEENLSEEKKRSLSAEVYSLQLVVEMRTGEVRSLREKLGIVTHQMESQAVTQSQLDKALARIEDLEEQLKQKVVKEQLISAEKWELESSVSESTKKMERMSMNVEELQWRIRNNFELPVDIYSKSPDKCLKSNFSDNNKANIRFSAEDNIQDSNKVIDTSSALNQKSGDLMDDPKVVAANDDTSPSSDVCMNYDTIHDIPEEDEELSDGNNNLPVNNDDYEQVDVNSLDEGLGDISSDSGGTESPQLKLNIHASIVNNNCEEKQDVKNNETDAGFDGKDRRPSRISFETPL